jgi:hypothetical protein
MIFDDAIEWVRFETELGSAAHSECLTAYLGRWGYLKIDDALHVIVDAKYVETSSGRVSWLARRVTAPKA